MRHTVRHYNLVPGDDNHCVEAGKSYNCRQMKTVRIAMCQIFSLDGDRAGNFVRIENALGEAKAAGAEIACFPETALLGWVNPDAHKRACPIPGADSARLCKLARAYDIYLCAGLDEKGGAELYDSALLIDNRGRILLKHRKIILLAELMTPPYAAGKASMPSKRNSARLAC